MTSREPGGVRLGILMHCWSDPERPFGNLTPFARIISQLGREEGVSVLVIDPEEFQPKSGRVHGLRLAKGGGWAPASGPLPDVLWNRCFRRDDRADVEDLLHACQRRGLLLLNEIGLNKWEAYQLLKADPLLREHLPETRLLNNGEETLDLLHQFSHVFLKPVVGSVGRGIIRASAQPTGLIRLEYIAAETGEFRVEEATPKLLARWAKERAGTYIAQQGLDLKVFYGRAADVRALIQKDGEGRWQLTGMGARVAAPGRFTSNLHTGGSGIPFRLLAGAVVAEDSESQETLELELQALAARTATLVESALGPMGELGLDFGIDRQGQIWYIEQNAQPGRSLFEHLGREDLSELAHRRPVQYARYLARAKSARAAGHQET